MVPVPSDHEVDSPRPGGHRCRPDGGGGGGGTVAAAGWTDAPLQAPAAAATGWQVAADARHHQAQEAQQHPAHRSALKMALY